MKTGARFVWVVTNGTMQAEKWPADAPAGACYMRSENGTNHGRAIAAEHMISDAELSMPIAELQAKYPAPGAVGEILSPLGFWS